MAFETSLFQESRLLFSLITLAFLMLFLASYQVKLLFWGLFVLYILLALLLIWFYRFPNLSNFRPNIDNLLAPCDGVVKSLDFDAASGRYKIIVFLNILDQHHQYYPTTGIVIGSTHTPGSFHPAYILEKSQYNERHLTTIRTKHGEPVTITQIAGQVARRIVNNSVPGAPVEQGERIGMIKLSSRVDIEFSKAHFIPLVTPGMRIKALETAIAQRLSTKTKSPHIV